MSSVHRIIFSFIIVFFASVIQGTVGFGFSLIAVPLLAFILPMKIIVPIAVVYNLVINIMVVLTTKKYIRLRKIWIMIVCGIIGIPIGVFGLKNLNPEVLKAIIGFLICITSISMAKGYKVKFNRVKISYGITGFISGVLNGSLSMSGPPIVLFLSNEGYDKNEFRANLATYATITNILTIIAFMFSGLLSTDMLHIIGTNIISLLLGTSIGIIIASKITDKYFKKIVLLLLAIIGIVTVINVMI